MPSVTAVKVLMSNNLTRKNQHLLASAGAREPLKLALYVSDCYLLVYLILSRESPTSAPVSGSAKKLEPPLNHQGHEDRGGFSASTQHLQFEIGGFTLWQWSQSSYGVNHQRRYPSLAGCRRCGVSEVVDRDLRLQGNFSRRYSSNLCRDQPRRGVPPHRRHERQNPGTDGRRPDHGASGRAGY